MEELSLRALELIAAGRELHRMGLVPATSGNLSARLDDGFAVTASGVHKGYLTAADILRLDAGGRSVDGRAPSAETPLHLQVYRRLREVGAVLHCHATSATVLSRLRPDGVALAGWELQKAFAGVRDPEAPLQVPVFANDQDVPRLALAVDAWMDSHPAPVGYMLAAHGFYTWGATVREALTRVEALDTLFRCELELAAARHG